MSNILWLFTEEVRVVKYNIEICRNSLIFVEIYCLSRRRAEFRTKFALRLDTKAINNYK